MQAKNSLVAHWSRAFLILAFVNLGIRITKLNSDITLQFVLETDSLHKSRKPYKWKMVYINCSTNFKKMNRIGWKKKEEKMDNKITWTPEIALTTVDFP